jgi:hypothetical protein
MNTIVSGGKGLPLTLSVSYFFLLLDFNFSCTIFPYNLINHSLSASYLSRMLYTSVFHKDFVESKPPFSRSPYLYKIPSTLREKRNHYFLGTHSRIWAIGMHLARPSLTNSRGNLPPKSLNWKKRGWQFVPTLQKVMDPAVSFFCIVL